MPHVKSALLIREGRNLRVKREFPDRIISRQILSFPFLIYLFSIEKFYSNIPYLKRNYSIWKTLRQRGRGGAKLQWLSTHGPRAFQPLLLYGRSAETKKKYILISFVQIKSSFILERYPGSV
jgi:hypothetical protein